MKAGQQCGADRSPDQYQINLLLPQMGELSDAHPHGGFAHCRFRRWCICRGESFATPHSTFLIMTTINTDFSTELLDQELNLDEMQDVNGGFLILAVPFIIGEIEKASNA